MPIPPYVAGLRARIGHDLLWLPGVTAVVLDGARERVLMNRRTDSGSWALISGILDPGEQPAVGIAREVREETGVEVCVEALAAVTVTEALRYPNGDVSQYVDLCFVARLSDPARADDVRVADDESLEVAWFRLDALPSDVSEHSAQRLTHVLGFLRDPSAGPWFAT